MRTHFLSLAAVALSATSAFAMGDRTGACVAAAVIDNGAIARAYFCADPKSQRPYDEHTAFEIGSVTKTMTAALLAEFIARGEVTLGDPVAKLLPPGTSVPSCNGREITRRTLPWNANPRFLQPYGPDEEPIASLATKAALKARVGNDPTIGGPAWAATRAGPFLAERAHHTDSR